MKKTALKHKPSVLSVTSLVILLIYSIIILLVFAWAVVFSLTDYTTEIFLRNRYLVMPAKIHFENFAKVYEYFRVEIEQGAGTRFVYLPEMFLYSVAFSVGRGFFGALAPCLVAYAATKFKYRFNQIIDGIVFVVMILPIVGSLPSSIRVVYALNLNDRMIGLWIMGFAFAGMYYFVFKAAFHAVPNALSEAAVIDGANNHQIFLLINFPLVKITFLSVFTLVFVGNWNDYTTPLVYARSLPTAAYGLHLFIHQTKISQPTLMMTAAMLLMFPMLLLYIFANKFLLGNLTMGGVKG